MHNEEILVYTTHWNGLTYRKKVGREICTIA